MRSKKLITIGAICLALVAVSCKKSSDPTPDDNTNTGGTGSTNDSANCIAGMKNDFSGFPTSIQPYFTPDGYWDDPNGEWNDAFDKSQGGDFTFTMSDSCYANSYIRMVHKIGHGGFGLALLNGSNWDAEIAITPGATSTKFSAKVTSGYKFIWTSFPGDNGVNVADSLIGDGQWHDYVTTFSADTQTVISQPLTFVGNNAGGIPAGDSAIIEIRNIRFDN